MARKKVDGVIVAVRYKPAGEIDTVRAYERRGAVWSDQVLLNRNELSERLRHGKLFVAGERQYFYGSVFNFSFQIHQQEGYIVTEGLSSTHDLLKGVPVF